ncbi:MAG: hypothetical protein M5U26_06495 [Planctomycetota bacterium]|nr:hypothetical protein [Planctomycetota bacterium]
MSDSIVRCRRCGTILRNNRSACPSCGTEVGAEEAGGAEAAPAPGASGARGAGHLPVASSRDAALCPMCMATVPVATMVVYEGQKICPNCNELMSAKASKKRPPTQA